MTARPAGAARAVAGGLLLAGLPLGGVALGVPAYAAPGGQQCDPAVLADSEPLADADAEPNLPHERMSVEEAHTVATGRGVTVAVVDSGVAATGAYDRVGEFVVPGAGGALRSGHGTVVAGLIAGRHGMAPDARILDVRVHDLQPGVDDDGRKLDSVGLREGLEHLLGRNDVGVVNISLAMNADDVKLRRVVQRLVAKDVVVVAAAGNVEQERGSTFQGTPGSDADVFPADYPGVLAVSAVGPSNEDPSQFVRPNADTDVAAPTAGAVSVNVTGRVCRTDDQVATSWAAAEVSGLAALLREQYPRENAAQITARIMATTEGSGPRGADAGPENNWTGAGVVQAYDALTRELEPKRDGSVERSAAEVPADAQAPPAPERIDLFGSSRALLLWGGLVAGACLALASMLRPLVRRR